MYISLTKQYLQTDVKIFLVENVLYDVKRYVEY